jgi:hypothetical protein
MTMRIEGFGERQPSGNIFLALSSLYRPNNAILTRESEEADLGARIPASLHDFDDVRFASKPVKLIEF